MNEVCRFKFPLYFDVHIFQPGSLIMGTSSKPSFSTSFNSTTTPEAGVGWGVNFKLQKLNWFILYLKTYLTNSKLPFPRLPLCNITWHISTNLRLSFYFPSDFWFSLWNTPCWTQCRLTFSADTDLQGYIIIIIIMSCH